MNILISTIIRNRLHHLNTWIDHLKYLFEINKDHNFYLSVYENDSVDGSDLFLKSFNFSFCENNIISEKLNKPYFGSSIEKERVELLANSRNKTLYENDFLEKSDCVLVVEPDVIYNPHDITEIINNKEYDILSARSIHLDNWSSDTHIYDKWGTRLNKDQEWWVENFIFQDNILDVWSTFNCVCKYKSEPIKNKIAFSSFNKRLNKHDCDTAVICENFRESGFNKIGLYGKKIVYHNQ